MMGLDPEFFVLDGANRIIPAELFIPTPSSKPWSHNPVVYDNAAVEIRPAPAGCLARGVGNVRETVWHSFSLWRLARKRGKVSPVSHPSLSPVAPLHPRHLKLPSVQEFGCSPSNVVLADGSLTSHHPSPDPMVPFRSAGFHLHSSRQFGQTRYEYTTGGKYKRVTPNVDDDISRYIQSADLMLGLVDVIMCSLAGWTEESQQRRLGLQYGLAGEYRWSPDQCRLEYRTMSPWLLSHPIWTYWGMTSYRDVTRMGIKDTDRFLSASPDRSEVIEAIQHCDASQAKKLWLHAAKAWCNVFSSHASTSAGLTRTGLRRLYLAMQNGGHTYYTSGWDMARAWFRNERAFNADGDGAIDERPARYYRKKKRKGIRYYFGGNHDAGARRKWYSGTSRVLSQDHNNPTLPDLS